MAEILPMWRKTLSKHLIKHKSKFAISDQPEKRQSWNSRQASQNECSKEFNS